MGLSASLVEKTKPKAIDQWLSDGDGLYLVVTPKGSKIWKLKYSKPYSKKRTNITIGTYPAYSLKDARDLCAEYQVLLARNIDPQEHIKQHTQQEIQRRETTFSVIAEQWKASKTNIKPSTLEKYWRIVELYLLPQLGSLPITDITPRIVKPVLDIPYQQGKAEMFRKSIKLLNAILNYAVNLLFALDANPCLKITTAFESLGRGTNPNIHFDDLPEFLNDLLNSNVDLLTRYLVLWQLLTMTRPTEAAETQWHEIDEQKALWTIPPERMKNKAEHRIFLSTQALRLLQKIKQFKIDTNPYLFVSYRAKTGHLN
ncbi:MAG: integrase arm-type DNA-binding domain-containing protein, partial [Haemophilus parahaemolyticus]|uniref:tyrosine-type recombinase/integrase n=1 Tax=Haemophilus parahaemolyticus TaxID=735 RepID=UPI0026E9616C